MLTCEMGTCSPWGARLCYTRVKHGAGQVLRSVSSTGEEIRKGVINERVGAREVAAGDPTCSAA